MPIYALLLYFKYADYPIGKSHSPIFTTHYTQLLFRQRCPKGLLTHFWWPHLINAYDVVGMPPYISIKGWLSTNILIYHDVS